MAQDLVYSERSTHVSHHVASDGDGGGDLPLVVVNQGDPEDAGKVSQSSALPGSDDYIPPSWPWAPRKCCGGRNQGNEEQMCSPSAHPGAASLARCGQGAWVLPQRLFQLAPCQSHVSTSHPASAVSPRENKAREGVSRAGWGKERGENPTGRGCPGRPLAAPDLCPAPASRSHPRLPRDRPKGYLSPDAGTTDGQLSLARYVEQGHGPWNQSHRL
ncbi:uncharacterized protein LOC103005422 [Balaenoptera acutorostrata]|uniref:Uncharacterized protein LOC103005422 n=1 Tax=Balaenoptera acutorostrata TaxID=9767 RepID=A0ABM3TN79_BALAC|nr:uncharacterized protein LOC103005422 [Balaenoptera acutorostrata]